MATQVKTSDIVWNANLAWLRNKKKTVLKDTSVVVFFENALFFAYPGEQCSAVEVTHAAWKTKRKNWLSVVGSVST